MKIQTTKLVEQKVEYEVDDLLLHEDENTIEWKIANIIHEGRLSNLCSDLYRENADTVVKYTVTQINHISKLTRDILEIVRKDSK